jgi:glycosyltransferase involved in cell wall biosynthesis
MLDKITPVILARNEMANIGRTLAALDWAREIIVVDSGSDDGTVEFCRSLPGVRVVHRDFDSHSNQWNFAVSETGISTPWILALDADYVMTPALVQEIAALVPDDAIEGYRVAFTYCIDGHPLRGMLYPPVICLFRTGAGTYRQDGHTQRLDLPGSVQALSGRMLHDDRKDIGRWLQSQFRYAELESDLLEQSAWTALGWQDRLRCCLIITPWLVSLYCLLFRGGLLDGWKGLHYAMQRGLAEGILSLCLLDRRIKRKNRAG